MSFKEKFRVTIGAEELIHYIFRSIYDIRAAMYERPKHELAKLVSRYRAAVEALLTLLPDSLVPEGVGVGSSVKELDSTVKRLANHLYEKGLYLRVRRVPITYETYEEWEV